MIEMLKPPAETLYEAELRALQQEDQGHRPPNWLLSPANVRDFIVGRDKPAMLDGEKITITRKFYGNDVLIERAVVTLAGNRGLMLVGEPGTAKTMLSELLTAADLGDQSEYHTRYSWNNGGYDQVFLELCDAFGQRTF